MVVRTRPQKTAALTARRIVADIEREGLSAGDKLQPEKVMLDHYKVSRGTLREALRFLELQGVISLRPGPGGGPVVQVPEAWNLATSMVLALQFRDAPFRVILEAREALEPLMAAKAASHISADDLAALTESVEQMERDLKDLSLFLIANQRFHDIIAWASDNSLFGLLIDAILGMMDGTVLGMEYSIPRRKAILKAHQQVHQAIKDRDPDAAQAAMKSHIDEYLEYAKAKFPGVLGGRVTWSLLE